MPETASDGPPEVGQPPVLSVVVPSARGGAYLRSAVVSVLEQSVADLEVVVVADGCPDPLADLEGLDSRVRVLRQRRRGVAVARNVGVRAARAALVAFLDDDDRMLPGRLAAQQALMTSRPEVTCCHTQFRVIDAEGRPVAQGFAADVQYLDLLRREVRILMPTTMMRKALLQEVGGFDPLLLGGEDLDLIYRLAREGPLAFLPEILTEYRRHGANTSGDLYQAELNAIDLLRKHRARAQAAGEQPAAGAAAEGLRTARRAGAAAAVSDARARWAAREPGAVLAAVRRAAAMSPRYALEDLGGNRWPLRLLRRQGWLPRRPAP